MNKQLKRSAIGIAAVLAFALPLSLAIAAGGGGGGASGGGGSAGGGNGSGAGTNGQTLTINSDAAAETEYAQAQAAITQQDFQGAVSHLNNVLVSQPNNPDVLNLMGFSKRKLGDQTGAMEYYDKALSLQPNHIGANEYLGELYLEMKLPAKAQERLDVLQQACGNCEEYGELKEKIEKYNSTNG
ncbi:MAG TPA: tetratricopeptide repeat protein [Candidatus Polarisedimenticolia bacterium]|jgi:predicted Zn-dependent protease|nr:tetratricopeptide repeat protein [Candidatus Polarisedimenticolia bacterium]